jgi:hypothetical protein
MVSHQASGHEFRIGANSVHVLGGIMNRKFGLKTWKTRSESESATDYISEKIHNIRYLGWPDILKIIKIPSAHKNYK